MTLDDITTLATRHYGQRPDRYRNPYRIGSPEFDAYERGWMQGLKGKGGGALGKLKSGPAIKR
jgi:hypothetical protein